METNVTEGIVVPQTNPLIPTIPHMADLSDILSNFANNWFHLRFVFAVLFGTMFAFYLIGKIMVEYKDTQRDNAWFESMQKKADMRNIISEKSAIFKAGVRDKLWQSSQDSKNSYNQATAMAKQAFKQKMYQKSSSERMSINTQNWLESFHVKNREKIDAWKDAHVEKLEFKDRIKYGG